MKNNMKTIWSAAILVLGLGLTSCSDANEYEDSYTDNPQYAEQYPESIDGTTWVRGTGMKYSALGEEIQGFVDTLQFFSADSVYVKMSQGVTNGTWTNESGKFKYVYSSKDGVVEIKKKSDPKVNSFSGRAIIAAHNNKDVIILSHFGDTPSQTYLVKE